MCACICICVFMTVSQFYLLKNIDKLSFLLFNELYSSNQVLLVEKAMAPHSSTLAWKTHGWRSLVGCSPWGHEESDTTE